MLKGLQGKFHRLSGSKSKNRKTRTLTKAARLSGSINTKTYATALLFIFVCIERSAHMQRCDCGAEMQFLTHDNDNHAAAAPAGSKGVQRKALLTLMDKRMKLKVPPRQQKSAKAENKKAKKLEK